jgi:hypothetical protein
MRIAACSDNDVLLASCTVDASKYVTASLTTVEDSFDLLDALSQGKCGVLDVRSESILGGGEAVASQLAAVGLVSTVVDSDVRSPAAAGGGHSAASSVHGGDDDGTATGAVVTGALRFTVLEGKALKNMDVFSKQDPYVKLSLRDSAGALLAAGQTGVVRRGGTDVKVWA